MFKVKVVTVAIALIALGLGTAAKEAQASPITFNDGSGAVQVFAFDPAPGNALAQSAVPLAIFPASNSFTLLYQATMSNFLNGVGNPIIGTNLNSSYEITVVAGAGETASRLPGFPAGGQSASFTYDPTSTTNFFYMYLDPLKNSNNLAGTGFTNGILLMSGSVTSSNGNFTIPTNTNIQPLDQFGTNNYPLLSTVVGSGATTALLDILVTSINPLYFPDAPGTLNLEMAFNTSTVTPFNEQDPSAAFSSNGIANGNVAPVRDPSNINGFQGTPGVTSDFQFQADSNIGVNAEVVPEPSTVVLLGLGVVALAGSRLRLRRKN